MHSVHILKNFLDFYKILQKSLFYFEHSAKKALEESKVLLFKEED